SVPTKKEVGEPFSVRTNVSDQAKSADRVSVTTSMDKKEAKEVPNKKEVGESVLIHTLIEGTRQNETVPNEKVKQIELLHYRLGHISKRKIIRMIKSGIILGIDIKDLHIYDKICESCLVGKMHDKPFKQAENPPSRPLEIIHCDIAGP